MNKNTQFEKISALPLESKLINAIQTETKSVVSSDSKDFLKFTSTSLLDIQNLTVSTEGKIILKNLTLSISENEIHLLLGPNGSGKSTLAKILVGHPSYQIEEGKIFYCGIDLVNIPPEKRSLLGIFASFQDPPTISGL
eukprot:gene2238-3182_t